MASSVYKAPDVKTIQDITDGEAKLTLILNPWSDSGR
jgi:hypothetical protein